MEVILRSPVNPFGGSGFRAAWRGAIGGQKCQRAREGTIVWLSICVPEGLVGPYGEGMIGRGCVPARWKHMPTVISSIGGRRSESVVSVPVSARGEGASP